MFTPSSIIQFRTERGLSQREMAELLGVDQGTVSKMETGKIRPSGPVERLLSLLSREAAE
ncbi:hypothetical protein ASG19_06590 [Rhizobium sp. Leaf306]|nr:hypothetical protein ASG19_06590 [Rhizobium sp. Leaf306]